MRLSRLGVQELRGRINNDVLNIAVRRNVSTVIGTADTIVIMTARFVDYIERGRSGSRGADLVPRPAIDVDVINPPADREHDKVNCRAAVEAEAELKRCPFVR